MRRGFIGIFGAAGAFAFVALSAGPVSAESPAKFYSKNKLTIFHAASAKGSYGLHSRLLQKYLTKHIPGHPRIALQFMPGGGGKKAANWLYNLAPKDGSAIAVLLKTMAEAQAVRAPGVRYDMRKFKYIASVGPMNSVLAVWNKTSPATSIEDMKKKVVIVGSTGKTSVTNICPQLMNRYLGTKFNLHSAGTGHIADKYLTVARIQRCV
jgi:tripartite-type tricarboxylate transporter receptor subunit TctC